MSVKEKTVSLLFYILFAPYQQIADGAVATTFLF